MPFIPHTLSDTQTITESINIDEANTLYDEIPPSLMPPSDTQFDQPGLSEMSITRLMLERQTRPHSLCFIGAGAYEHHIPAAIGDIIGRGEFYSAYTPYQAEASQGSLQVMYEYQTMITQLMGMEVSNASLYDGATALAEAALMACRLQRKKKPKIIIPQTLHPSYRDVIQTLLIQQNIEIITIDHTPDGLIDIEQFTLHSADTAAAIVPQPNFFGLLEDVNTLTDTLKQNGALTIAQVNPIACGELLAPGDWGEYGADIACGDGQPLGVPLSGGGPYFGFMCTRKQFIRQLPGRIVAKTTDLKDKPCYTLTLQAREQHIRRGKATSNICTNQGLMVVAASIYLNLMGGSGLQSIAQQCHRNTRTLIEQLTRIDGVELVFSTPYWHEAVIRFTTAPVNTVLDALHQVGIDGGFNLQPLYPALGECLLVCATETKTLHDIEHYAKSLSTILRTQDA